MAHRERSFMDRRHVMKIDGNLVIAYNTDRPYPPQVDRNYTTAIQYMHLPVHESRDVPYLCAAPASPDYSGAILGRLSQTVDHYPLVQSGSRFSLEPKLASRWQSLEHALMGVALCLLQHSGEPVVPLEYRFPPSPQLQGYLNSHSSPYAARMAIQRSRDAFQPLIAHAAWAAILHRSRTFWTFYSPGADITAILDKSWVDTLVEKGKVHHAWVEELRMSAICDFSIQRSGLVLRNPREWMYSPKLIALVLSNVPVWMVWGKGPCSLLPSTWTADLMQKYGPSEKEAIEAKSWLTPPKTPKAVPKPLPFNQTEKACGARSLIENTTSIPPIADDHVKSGFVAETRPYQHVDVHEWIGTKEILISKAMADADHTKITKWRQRQEAAKSFSCPGERGALVYEWDRDDQQRPIRMRVNRANVEQAWYMFANTQRWYNCVQNEWELCHELDPTAVPQDINDEYDDYVLDHEEKSIVDLEGWLTKDSVDVESGVRMLASNTFGPEDIAVQSRRDLGGSVMDAFELISLRFGYAYVNGSKYETTVKPPIKLQKALRIIGDGFDMPVYKMEAGAEASFIQYVMYLDAVGHPDVDLSEVPGALCDLYPDNPLFLGNRPSTVTVQKVVYMETTLYIIRHLTEDNGNDWVLAVKDPCTAVQCIRSRPTSVTELVREFIHAKTPFYTLKPIPDSSSTEIVGRALPKSENFIGTRIGLGVRPLGHVLDLTDYVAYEAAKLKLIQNKRIARAVVKRGGVISRLSAGLVDEYDVLDGPIWDNDGKCIRVSITVNDTSREYFDDDISLEELATFVGLYSFEVPKIAAPTETSWWPTFNKFEESGLNLGVWTPRCEQWFQTRRTEILEKGYSPLTSSKWRNALRCEMETKRMYKASRALAARYLADHCEWD